MAADSSIPTVPLGFRRRPYVLLPVGYPAEDCRVPAIDRKPLSDVLIPFSSDAGGGESSR